MKAQKIQTRKNAKRPVGRFQKEARWMSFSGLAPVGIGVILALVFWFTR
jgi:hypothetical protein